MRALDCEFAGIAARSKTKIAIEQGWINFKLTSHLLESFALYANVILDFFFTRLLKGARLSNAHKLLWADNSHFFAVHVNYL